MLLKNKYRILFDDIKKCARLSIEMSSEDQKYLPGIKYLEDHFLFDLPIYRNLRIVRRLAKTLPKNAKVLDWGCGYGDASFMLRSFRPDLDTTSYDVFSSPPWEVLAKRANLNKVTDSNEEKLPFQTGYFDIVAGIGVLEHVKDQNRSLEEIGRILKPGGKFYVFLYPNRSSYTERFQKTIGNPHHDKPLNMKELEKILIDSGFTIDAKEYQLALPIMLSRFPLSIRKIYNIFGNLIVFLNYILEKIPILNKLNSNLMVVGIKK